MLSSMVHSSRKWLGRLAAGALALGLICAQAAPAAAAVTSQEWAWITLAQGHEARGEMDQALELWQRIALSTSKHDMNACGLYAQKVARALDDRGRYAEAVVFYDQEVACWSKVTNEDTSGWYRWDALRAQQIRPQIQTYVGRPTQGTQVGGLAKHEPLYGTMIGGTIDLDPAIGSDIAKTASVYGKTYGMVLAYAPWNGDIPHTIYNESKRAGVPLQVSWEPGQGLAAVKDDAYVRGFAKRLAEYGHPVFLRFGAEMNGNWTNWSGDPKLYREKFALIARIMREEAPNVAMVWAPNWVGSASPNLHEYYPGDDVVDWVGVNVYFNPYFMSDPTMHVMQGDLFLDGKRVNPLDKVREMYETYAARKPIMLAETGFGWANRNPKIDETAWAQEQMERFFGYLPLVFPRIKAIAYFNVDFNARPGLPGASHYLLSGNTKVTETYKKVTAQDWYLGHGAKEPAMFWRPIGQATLDGKLELASYVNLFGGVSRVEYLLDGRLVATATQLPWRATVDVGGLTGEHKLTVRAYDWQGKLGHEQSYHWNASAIKVTVNGRVVDFDQPPVVLEGRTLVPLRAIVEALGAEVTWEGATRTAVMKKDASTVRLQIDNPVPTKDGRALAALDVPGKIINNRTLVPARFVGEAFGMDVSWNAQTQTVIIRDKQ